MSNRSPLTILCIILSLLGLSACAEGVSGRSTPSDTGSSGADMLSPDVSVPDTSTPDTSTPPDTSVPQDDGSPTGDTAGDLTMVMPDLGGEGVFAGCVLNEAPPLDPCAEPAVLDFGTLNAGETRTRLLRLENGTDDAVDVTGIMVASTDFTVDVLLYAPDGVTPIPVNFPFTVARSNTLWAEVHFAASVGGPLPADQITFTATDGAGGPASVTIDMIGEVAGCAQPNLSECDGDPTTVCETDTDTDDQNCGGCGVSCDSPGGEAICNLGACEFTGCAAGFGDCDAGVDGCETDIQSDSDNCGGCGNTCVASNGSNACVDGACAPACNPGADDCDGNPNNGCEPLNTLADCGACGVPCDIPGSVSSCLSGTCQATGCADAGTDNCDGDLSDGCEPLNTLIDCGSCGNTCDLPNASESCASGTCLGQSCDGGAANCDGDLNDGCEALNTTSNCGGCGQTCSLNNASSATCNGSSCSFSCNSGYGDCDGDGSNGCETQTNTLTHCGGCNVGCDLPNATESCGSGSCQILTCTGDYAHCDGSQTNGCETDLDPGSNCTTQATTYLGSVSGDTSSGASGWEYSASGAAEQVFYTWVTEDDSGISAQDLYLAVFLQNNSTNDYSLHIGPDDCGEVGCWSRRDDTGPGGDEYHSIQWQDAQPGDSSRNIYIWVRHLSGNDCGGYTVFIDGFAFFSERHHDCSP